MGIHDAFSTNANFDKISRDISLSKIVHKSKITVDEEGTVASAVTSKSPQHLFFLEGKKITMNAGLIFCFMKHVKHSNLSCIRMIMTEKIRRYRQLCRSFVLKKTWKNDSFSLTFCVLSNQGIETDEIGHYFL